MNLWPYDRYMSFLEKELTPARLQHSLGVMQMMGELSDVYDLDREQALTAGLLHDAAKDFSPTRQEQAVKEANIAIHYPCDWDYGLYLHGPVGSYFVQKELGIMDRLILDSITMHSFYGGGENFSAPFTWCLRFSDVLEPNRNWIKFPWSQEKFLFLRKTVYDGCLEEAAYLQTKWLIQMFEEQNYPVHPNMRRVCQELAPRFS